MKHQPNTEPRLPIYGIVPGSTIKEKFEIEKNAKNRAYSFILSRGLLYEFRDWCKATDKINPFELCKHFLIL